MTAARPAPGRLDQRQLQEDRTGPVARRAPGHEARTPATAQHQRFEVVLDARPVPYPAARRPRYALRITVAVIAAVALLAGLGFAAAWLVGQVVQNLAAILGAVALFMTAWWLLSRVGVCPGLHCPGCKHS